MQNRQQNRRNSENWAQIHLWSPHFTFFEFFSCSDLINSSKNIRITRAKVMKLPMQFCQQLFLQSRVMRNSIVVPKTLGFQFELYKINSCICQYMYTPLNLGRAMAQESIEMLCCSLNIREYTIHYIDYKGLILGGRGIH